MESELDAKPSKLDAPLATVNIALLPTDVLHEILLRLPAKVLCRFRLVCRSWRSLTSNPIFARAHSSRHPLVVGLRSVPFPGRGRRRRGDHDEVQLLDPFSGNIVRRIRTGQDWNDHELSTHLGLLCISERRRAQEEATVLNPATGEILMLPTTGIVTKYEDKSMPWSTCILGWVPSTGEYKTLRICWYDNNRLYQDGEPKQTYHVTALGGDASWRLKPCPPVRVSVGSTARAVVNGVAYFLLDVDPAKSDDVIAVFNLATEEWRHAMLRGPLNGIRVKDEDRRSFHLADLNGCLVSICRTWGYGYDNCSVDLWFLVDVDKELWTKRYSLRSALSIGHPEGLFTPLAILYDERILMWVQGVEELRAYDPKTSTWTNLSTIKNIFHIGMYQGSLLC